MSKSVKPGDLAAAIQKELTIYTQGLTERVNAAGRTSANKLKKLTKATAPKASGDYRKHIAVKEVDAGNGMKKYIWYVKKPDHRLTHLLVHGHPAPNGRWVDSDPFLANAMKIVEPEYVKAVEEAVKNG